MSGQIKKVQDCSSGREFAQFAKDRGFKVTRGQPRNYNYIEGRKGAVSLKDSDKPMCRQERLWVIDLFIKIGIVMIPLALLGGAAYVLSALTGAPLF